MNPKRRYIAAVLASTLLILPAATPAAQALGLPLADGVTIDASTFPDSAFRSWLLDGRNLSGAGADSLLTADELAAIQSLDLSGLGIADLEGIQVFTALKRLNIRDNTLTELDLSANTSLTSLDAGFNRLTELDLSNHAVLRTLNCQNNQLTSLDLTGAEALVWLYARSNQLTGLDLSDSTALEYLDLFENKLASVDISMLPALRFLHISYNQLTELDLSANLALEGGGFIAEVNNLLKVSLPVLPNMTVITDNFREQSPSPGYDRVVWSLDEAGLQPVEESFQANGQILYGKRIANQYTIYFSANGGQGNTGPVQALYDQETSLTPNGFTRYGYTFQGWNTLSWGAGDAYTDSQRVTNLSGIHQGDRITLYAQWQPVNYTISFDANGGQGSMDSADAVYDQASTLPDCDFTNDGMEFAGWATEADGPVRYLPQDRVKNLSMNEGGEATLYAVWKTPVAEEQEARLTQLQQAFGGYSSQHYAPQDWTTLSDCYAQAADAIRDESDNDTMDTLVTDCISAMSQVPTLDERTQEVAQGWRATHSQVLSLAEAGALEEAAAPEALRLAQAALAQLEDGSLNAYSTLISPEDQALAAAGAAALLEADKLSLADLHEAAQWLSSLNGLTGVPGAQVTSQRLEEYRKALESLDRLTPGQQAVLAPSVSEALNRLANLADQKRTAVSALQTAYQGYDLTEYTYDGQAALFSALEQAVQAVEGAEDQSQVQTAHDHGLTAMAQVPNAEGETPELPPQPENPGEPDGPGDSGNSGSGGGSSGGSGGGSNGGGSSGGGSDNSQDSNTVTITDDKTGTVTKVTTSADGSVEAAVTVPQGVDSVVVNIPCTPSAGTVALLVEQDGSTQVLPKSAVTADGVAVRLDGSAKLRLTDNSKSFSDVEGDSWYEAGIQYAASRELLRGVGGGRYAPMDTMDRAMLVTALHRLERTPQGADASFSDVEEGTWYADSVSWAAQAGIVQGVAPGSFAPHAPLTRESLAVLLYRYADQQGLDLSARSQLSGFADSGAVSPWAEDALSWACASGLLEGDGGSLRPGAACTRAEASVILERFASLLTAR